MNRENVHHIAFPILSVESCGLKITTNDAGENSHPVFEARLQLSAFLVSVLPRN
jgi:hypothetical protein